MRYIAFLRAVNVAGRFVKMADLRAGLEAAGFIDVETHIQSGNVAIGSKRRSIAAVRADLEQALREVTGFDIPAIVRTPAGLRAFVQSTEQTPLMLPDAKRYVAFADAQISTEAAAVLSGWNDSGECAAVIGDTVIADLSVDFHKTKLTNARIEKITGLTTTWRDFNVVRAIDEKWGA